MNTHLSSAREIYVGATTEALKANLFVERISGYWRRFCRNWLVGVRIPQLDSLEELLGIFLNNKIFLLRIAYFTIIFLKIHPTNKLPKSIKFLNSFWLQTIQYFPLSHVTSQICINTNKYAIHYKLNIPKKFSWNPQ